MICRIGCCCSIQSEGAQVGRTLRRIEHFGEQMPAEQNRLGATLQNSYDEIPHRASDRLHHFGRLLQRTPKFRRRNTRHAPEDLREVAWVLVADLEADLD